MAKDFKKIAEQVLENVGGIPNIKSVVHCMTRLRFNLKDSTKADDASIKKISGISGLVKAGGLYQVIVGPDVPLVYQELLKLGVSGEGTLEINEGDKTPLSIKKVFNAIISYFSRILGPIILPLCGVGIISAIVSILQLATLGNPQGVVLIIYNILDASSKGLLYFIPFLIMISASKVFKMDPFVGCAIIGSLIFAQLNHYYEGIIVINGVDILKNAPYTSNMLTPIFVALGSGFLYRYLLKHLPGVIKTFFAPAITILVFVPATIFIIGPLMGLVGLGLSVAFNAVQTIPYVGLPIFGALFGFFWQILVMFGVHGIIMLPIMQDMADGLPMFIIGPLMLAVLAQFAAVLAIAIKVKNSERKAAAISASVSALFGITEPAIYGFTLPKKTPFFIAAGFSALAGLILGIFGFKGGMAGQGIFFLLGYVSDLNALLVVTLITIGMVVGIVLTVFSTYKLQPEDLEIIEIKDDSIYKINKDTALAILSPVEGRALNLGSAKDPAFRTGTLGKGVAIIPEKFKNIVAPVSGTLVSLFPTGHAFGIVTSDGVEVLVHIGVDTVKLNGKGFDIKSAQGKEVKAGDVIVTVDKDIIARAGYSNETYVVISNTNDLNVVAPKPGKVKALEPIIYVDSSRVKSTEPVTEVKNA